MYQTLRQLTINGVDYEAGKILPASCLCNVEQLLRLGIITPVEVEQKKNKKVG